jgi:hypothetical protein
MQKQREFDHACRQKCLVGAHAVRLSGDEIFVIHAQMSGQRLHLCADFLQRSQFTIVHVTPPHGKAPRLPIQTRGRFSSYQGTMIYGI